MKRIVGILSVLLLISCSPDAKLVAENEKLKLEAEKQRELAIKSAEEARRAQAEAAKAAEEAQRQAAMANVAMEQADKQRQAAEAALKKLKDCQ